MQTGASSIPCCSKAAGSIRRHCRSLSRSLLAGEILGLVLVEVTAEPEPHKISGAKHRAVVCRGAGDSQGCIFWGIQLGMLGMPDFQRPCSPGNKIKSLWGGLCRKAAVHHPDAAVPGSGRRLHPHKTNALSQTQILPILTFGKSKRGECGICRMSWHTHNPGLCRARTMPGHIHRVLPPPQHFPHNSWEIQTQAADAFQPQLPK